MQVENLIMYQVATDRDFKVGDILKFGQIENGQSFNVYNTSYQFSGNPLFKIGFESVNNENITNEVVIELSRALEKYDFAFREMAMEDVRREKFPNLPSRMKCMFLIDNREACLSNLPHFAEKGYGKIYQAIAVSITGNIFYAKDICVARRAMSYNDYKKEAEKYWAQDQNSESEVKEILFEGEAKVVEILKEIRL